MQLFDPVDPDSDGSTGLQWMQESFTHRFGLVTQSVVLHLDRIHHILLRTSRRQQGVPLMKRLGTSFRASQDQNQNLPVLCHSLKNGVACRSRLDRLFPDAGMASQFTDSVGLADGSSFRRMCLDVDCGRDSDRLPSAHVEGLLSNCKKSEGGWGGATPTCISEVT